MSTTAANAPIGTTRTPRRTEGRPFGRAVAAHPPRTARGMARGRVDSCVVRREPVIRRAVTLQRVKVAVLSAIAVAGAVVGVTGYAAALGPDPVVDAVQGDAAWAHVEK